MSDPAPPPRGVGRALFGALWILLAVILGCAGVFLWIQLSSLVADALGLGAAWLRVVALALWVALPLVGLWRLSGSSAPRRLKGLEARRGHLSPEDRPALLSLARELALLGEGAVLKARLIPLIQEVDPAGAQALGVALEAQHEGGDWAPVFDVLEAMEDRGD